LGAKKAIELMLTGDIIDAKEAERIGLINRVVPHDKLEETVMALARKLCKKSSLVMSAGRRSFYTMLGMGYNEAMIYLLDVLALIMSTEDSKEGLKAFLEKRKPVWKNR
jgi:enoyl-CoA hydratase/carnithine racemase